MTTVTTIPLACAACAKTAQAKPDKRGGPKMPRGKGGFWKRVGELAYCGECVRKLWALRALSLPARGAPLEGGTADDLWDALRGAWDQCVQLVNWATTELAKRDRFRRPGEDLQGKTFKAAAPPPRPYLYPEAAALFPGLPSQSVTAMLQAAQGKYDARRYDVLWRFKASLPNARSAPLCLSNQAWRAEWREVEEEDGEGGTRVVRVPVVTFPLAGRRWAVRLRLGAGEHARRSAEAFNRLADGSAIAGELALYAQRSSAGAHRATRPAKEAGGGNAVRTRLMVKLVARFPRQERERSERSRRGTLEVRTARNALFVAVAPGREEPWLLHADWLRGLVFAHRQRLQRLSDDAKAERRRPRRRRRGMQDHLDKVTYRYSRRLKSGVEYVGSQLMKFADRQGLALVRLDDRDRRYCPEFAWAMLRQTLERQGDNMGIGVEFVDPASGPAADETPESARGDE